MSPLLAAPAASQAERLHDSIHDLAQPLTALMFVLEMGRIQSKPEAWRTSLDTATDECRRAINLLEAVRVAADGCARLPDTGDKG